MPDERIESVFPAILAAAALGLGLLFSPGFSGGPAQDDKVEIVRNPVTPLSPRATIRFLDELKFEGGGDIQRGWSSVHALDADAAGNIFVLDGRENRIQVFDASGRYVKTIGRKGQGPGEFQAPERLLISPQGEIFVWDSARISVFSADGRYLRAFPSSILNEIEHCVIDDEGRMFGIRCLIMRKPYTRELLRLDPGFKPLKTFETYVIPVGDEQSFDPFRPMNMRIGMSREGLVVAATQDRYELRYYDADGQLRRIVRKDQERIPVTKRDLDALLKGSPPGFASQLRPSKYYPAWKQFFFDGKGFCYVATFARSTDGDRPLYDVFDAAGRYRAQIPIPADAVMKIKGDRLYALDFDPDGFPIIRRMRIVYD